MKIVGFLLGFLLCASFAFGIDVNFQWGMSTGDVDGYRIYYGDLEGGSYPERLCEVNGTTLNYEADLDETQEYYLVCRAFNKYGESKDSNEVHWSYAIPGIPGNLQWVTDLGQIKIQLVSE